MKKLYCVFLGFILTSSPLFAAHVYYMDLKNNTSEDVLYNIDGLRCTEYVTPQSGTINIGTYDKIETKDKNTFPYCDGQSKNFDISLKDADGSAIGNIEYKHFKDTSAGGKNNWYTKIYFEDKLINKYGMKSLDNDTVSIIIDKESDGGYKITTQGGPLSKQP